MKDRISSEEVSENSGKDFKSADVENCNQSEVKHYGRDLLLQLRLHPLSLQKPESLSNMEVVKEKLQLYLDDINESTCSTPADKHMDKNNYAMKSEYCNMKYEYPLVPHYFKRPYQYCYYPPGYNGTYQSASTKFRSSFQTYCNPLKKHCIANHHCKDFSMGECIWPSSEDIWNSYPSHVPSNLTKKREPREAAPPKKLSIIDPVTGENVLETFASIYPEKQNDDDAAAALTAGPIEMPTETYVSKKSTHAVGNVEFEAHSIKESEMPFCKESAFNPTDSMRENMKLKDKSYSLRQEHQKMAILQSFLRYKKYQLEENARNLDEKRIEIANWECNLFNKAKNLREKEMWLESRSEILYNKVHELAENEKLLNKGENKPSGDYLPQKSMTKGTQVLGQKFSLYNCSDTLLEEMPKIKTSHGNAERKDYSYFEYTSNPEKFAEDASLNVEKYKPDVSALDDLEELLEKMHLSNEDQVTNIDNKVELASADTVQKKDGSNSIAYSKGRHYFPEHIKYWLDNQDKNTL